MMQMRNHHSKKYYFYRSILLLEYDHQHKHLMYCTMLSKYFYHFQHLSEGYHQQMQRLHKNHSIYHYHQLKDIHPNYRLVQIMLHLSYEVQYSMLNQGLYNILYHFYHSKCMHERYQSKKFSVHEHHHYDLRTIVLYLDHQQNPHHPLLTRIHYVLSLHQILDMHHMRYYYLLYHSTDHYN